jgi:hypothetical protein
MLNILAISNHRSLRNLVVALAALNLITGPNGSGKSNLSGVAAVSGYRQWRRRWIVDAGRGIKLNVMGGSCDTAQGTRRIAAGLSRKRVQQTQRRPGSFLVVHVYLTAVKLCAIAFSFGNLKNLCDPRFGICPYSKFHAPRSR